MIEEILPDEKWGVINKRGMALVLKDGKPHVKVRLSKETLYIQEDEIDLAIALMKKHRGEIEEVEWPQLPQL